MLIRYTGWSCDEQPKNSNSEGKCACMRIVLSDTYLYATRKAAQTPRRDACLTQKTHVSCVYYFYLPTVTVFLNSINSRRGGMEKLHGSVTFDCGVAQFYWPLLNGCWPIDGSNGGTYLADGTKVTIVLSV